MHDYKRFPLLFKHHFGGHHKLSRMHGMRDKSYDNIYAKTSLFEFASLLFGAIIHLPILYYFPFAYITLLAGTANYYYIHRKSHMDVNWARDNVPWHYDHHMAPNQHANWGVRLPIIDWIFGTRIEYKNTKKEEIKSKLTKIKE